MIATKKRVGRKDWLRLKIGEVGVFTLPDRKAREAARVAVSHLRHKYGHDFEYLELGKGDELAERSIAYRRLS